MISAVYSDNYESHYFFVCHYAQKHVFEKKLHCVQCYPRGIVPVSSVRYL